MTDSVDENLERIQKLLTMGEGNQVFYTNLLLLGFNPVAMEAKYQMKFHKDMFLKPNKKAFEVISHFLFSKLDAALCKERFRSCWPIFDKKQEQEFRKTCCNWIKDISIEYSEARFPRIILSIFLTPGGDKFIALYLSFSRYVLRKVIARDFGAKYLLCCVMPSFSHDYANTTRMILEISTNKAIQNFLRIQEVSQDLHKIWHGYARDIVSANRLLKTQINEKTELLKQKKEMLMSSQSQRPNNCEESFDKFSEPQLEEQIVNQQERMRKVSKIWKNLEEFQNGEEMYWDVLSSIVDSNNQNVVLEGSSMDFHIPDTFLQQCKDNLLQKGVTKICKSGKVDINSVLQMWNVCLKFQHEILMEAKLPDAKSWLEGLKDHVEDHCINLGILQKLSSKLNKELLPSIKASISGLNKILDIQSADTGINIQDQTFELCPVTPDLAFSPSDLHDQPVVPRRVISLSPVLGLSNDGNSRKEQKYVRSPLLTDPLATPVVKDFDKRDFSFRITPVIQLEQIGKKQRTKVIWATDKAVSDQELISCYPNIDDDNSDKMDVNQDQKIEEMNAVNLQSSTVKKVSDESFIVHAVAPMDDLGNDDITVTAVSENVKAKFAEMIVDSVIDDTAQDSLNSLPCESDSCFTLDLYEQTAFITRDRLARTPPSQNNENANITENMLVINENHQVHVDPSKLVKSLDSSISEMQTIFDVVCSPKQEGLHLDSITTNSDFCHRTLLDLSWDTEEEELLTKVTLPYAPSLDAVNERHQNSDTAKSSSKKALNTTGDGILNAENSFCDLLKQYSDLREDCLSENFLN